MSLLVPGQYGGRVFKSSKSSSFSFDYALLHDEVWLWRLFKFNAFQEGLYHLVISVHEVYVSVYYRIQLDQSLQFLTCDESSEWIQFIRNFNVVDLVDLLYHCVLRFISP